MAEIKNIIFDFGGVLVNWDPRYLYRKHFNNDLEMEYFLTHICSDEWHLEQDKGRSLLDGTKILQENHPEYSYLISLFYDQWDQMLYSEIGESVDILYKLKKNYRLFGLTNWSSETIDIAYKKFSFFKEFEGIVVSGIEKIIKPDLKLYKLLCERYELKPENCLFIDDKIANVYAAVNFGMSAIHFKTIEDFKKELLGLSIIY